MESYDSMYELLDNGLVFIVLLCVFCRTFSNRKVESCLQLYLVDFDILFLLQLM